MAHSINTNVSALSAQRYLNSNKTELDTAMIRLSSGLRINSAKDDPSGITLAERMSIQTRGLALGSRNANDAIDLAQTADAALSNVAGAMQRIRELAVQSANAGYSSTDRAAIQVEVRELIAEIQRVAGSTTFNGLNLLDGTFQEQYLQVGANAGQMLTIPALADLRTTSLGRSAVLLDGTTAGSLLGEAAAPGATAAAGSNGMDAATSLVLTNVKGSSAAISWAAGASAKDIAAAINAKTSALGIAATATNSATIGGFSAAGAMSFKLNGVTLSATLVETTDLTPLASAINSANAGVAAEFVNPPARNQLRLTAADGSDIRIEDFTNGTSTMTVTGSKTGATARTLTSGGATDSTIVAGTLEVVSARGPLSWTGGVEDAFGTGKTTGTASFNTLSDLNVGTAAGATSAMAVLDAALDQISSARSGLGAIQGRLEYLISNAQAQSEKISTARGRLVDADFAKETAELARTQILQKAGTAILAQANTVPESVLQLLKAS